MHIYKLGIPLSWLVHVQVENFNVYYTEYDGRLMEEKCQKFSFF